MRSDISRRPRVAQWVFAVVMPLAAFVALSARVATGAAFSWDDTLIDAVDAMAPISSSDVHVDPFLTTITFAVGAMTAAVAVALALKRRFRTALFLVLAVSGALVLGTIAKAIVQRPAIEGDPTDYSFPSGSATWSMATVVALFLLARTAAQRWLVAGLGAVLVLGFGWVIVWEQWHYPSDVVAGWCLAIAWVTALWLAVGSTASREAG